MPVRYAPLDSQATKDPPLPHPAEDLSADDDLLSWVLVDQLGAMPNTKLGVHPQQVKFVGPAFKPDEVLNIIKETVIKGNVPPAMQRLQDFHVLKKHLDAKTTDSQRDRFVQHLRRYLLPLVPSSRVEIHTTSRYSAVTRHTELAVFATRALAPGVVLQELQGSVVPLPEAWREEMELGEGFAVEAAGEESDSDEEEADEDFVPVSREKGKSVDRRQGARRSDRTKRRDFSIVWSGLKRCFQLFLGPARFLNHDCAPNVELLRQGKYVTFRVLRPVKVGDELTTFYGENYFGKGNIECLCLTCENHGKGGFTLQEQLSRSRSRDTSAGPSSVNSPIPSSKSNRPSSLRYALQREDTDSESEQATPVKTRGQPQKLSLNIPESPEEEGSENESDSPTEPVLRERSTREAARKVKPWAYLRRPKKMIKEFTLVDPAQTPEEEDLPDHFPRCATCAKALHERVWYSNRYFDHCQRCVRHALIFNLPWPAHRVQDVQEYPPAHLIPNGYIPRKISSFPLPSLVKISKKKLNEPEPMSPQPDTREQKLARRLRAEIEKEEFIVEQLREAAWARQEAKEAAAITTAEARAEAKRLREEAKKKRNENKIKGTGVWSRYEYLTPEEIRRQEIEKYKVTSGTRRGGRFRDEEAEEEMRRLAEEKRREEKERRYAQGHDGEEEDDDADGVDGEAVQTVEQENAEQEQEKDEASAEPEDPAKGSPQSVSPPKPRSRPRRSEPGKILSYIEAETDESEAEAETEFHRTPATRLPRISEIHLRDTQTPASQSDDTTPKRRGRPPGSGKHQKAAAIAAARVEAEAEAAAARGSINSVKKAKASSSSPAETKKNKKNGGVPTHVMTSGIELPARPSSSSRSVYPVIDGILLPPSKPKNPSDSELPSVDAASPEVELVDTLSSTGGTGEAEVEGEILVAPEEAVSDHGKRGKKRKRQSEGDSTSSRDRKRTFFATKIDGPSTLSGKSRISIGGGKPKTGEASVPLAGRSRGSDNLLR